MVNRIKKPLCSTLCLCFVAAFAACGTVERGTSGDTGGQTTVSSYEFAFDNAVGHAVQITKATDPEYILDDGDDWSFSYKPTGTWTFWRFKDSDKIDWENLKELKFSVYNPNYEYDYVFTVSLSETLELSHDVLGERFGTAYRAVAGSWTEFSVSGEAAKKIYDKGLIYLSMAMSYPDNGGYQSEQWSQAHLYFDGFELVEKN